MCAHMLPKITVPSARAVGHLPGHAAFRGRLGPHTTPTHPDPSSSAGGMCPFRHISGEKTVVCKHWLRGLCKKGDQCEFLHEYDMTKMPECYFYSKFGEACGRLPAPRPPG